MNENELGTIIVDCAFKVHQKLGPGPLESVYEVALAHEIKKHGVTVERQVPIPIVYENLRFDEGFISLLKKGDWLRPKSKKPLKFKHSKVPVPLFQQAVRADLIVGGLVIIELKSAEQIHAVYKKQLLTYLKLTEMRLGYLINFGAELIKDGLSRVPNGAADWKEDVTHDFRRPSQVRKQQTKRLQRLLSEFRFLSADAAGPGTRVLPFRRRVSASRFVLILEP